MTKIATGYVALKAEVDDLRRDLAKAQDQLERSTNQMQGQAVKTGKSFKAMWLAYAAGAAVVAATAMKAIKAASDLQETTSKFNVVFKGQQKLAESWSKTLVEGFAMSTRESKQYLSSVQDLLVPMGMAADEAGKLSFEIVKLSADLGSFNNIPTAMVMDDISRALVGEYESMKKYGVVLNATLVQQKALEMGLAKTKAELTAGMKAQAAYTLTVESSQAAIGDFARTADGYANTLKQAKASWEDFMASLGELILPVATKVLSGITSMIQGINDLIDTFKEGGTWIDKTEEWRAAALAAGGGGSFIPLSEGGAGGGGGAGEAATESAQIINMKEIMKQAKALRDEEDEDIWSTMAARDQYMQEMQTKDIERIGAELGYLEEYWAHKGEMRDENLRATEEALMAEVELTAAQIAAIEKMDADAARKKQQLYVTAAQAQLRTMSQTFLIMSTMAGKHSKDMFRLYQAAAIAEATVSGVKAAVHAWDWGMMLGGPGLAAAFAAASVAYTGAQIAAIASQSMPSAPVATPVASVGGGAAATVPGAELGRPEEEEQGQLTIIIEGDVLADELYIEMLAEKISEAVEGNEVRLIASETRAT